MKRAVGFVTMVAAGIGAWAFWRRRQQQPVLAAAQMQRGKVLLTRAGGTVRSAAAQAASSVTTGVRTAADSARARATEISGQGAASGGSTEYQAADMDAATAAGYSSGTPAESYGASVMGADDASAETATAGGGSAGVLTTDEVLSGDSGAVPQLEGTGSDDSGSSAGDSGEGSEIEGLLLETDTAQSAAERTAASDVETPASEDHAAGAEDATGNQGSRSRRRSSDA